MGMTKRVLVGQPMRSELLGEATLSKKIALPVFASDALSSVAYATEEILLVLSAGGMIHSWPIVLFWAWFATAVCAVPIIVHLVGKVGRCLKRLA